MGFRLVPKSVTLNDLERRNGRIVCVISPNSVAFGAYYEVCADPSYAFRNVTFRSPAFHSRRFKTVRISYRVSSEMCRIPNPNSTVFIDTFSELQNPSDRPT